MPRRDTRFDSIKTHVMRGKRFKIRWRRPPTGGVKSKGVVTVGMCDSPRDKDRTIYIAPEGFARLFQKGDRAILLTTIHELLHAACFDLDETVVQEFEASLDELLGRMGMNVHFDGAGQRRKEK